MASTTRSGGSRCITPYEAQDDATARPGLHTSVLREPVLTKKSHHRFPILPSHPPCDVPPHPQPLSRKHATMPSNGATQKKTAAKKTTASSTAAKNTTAKPTATKKTAATSTTVTTAPPVKRTVPKPRKQATVATPEPATTDESLDTQLHEAAVIEKYRSERRTRRRLLTLKIISYVLVVYFLVSVGLAIWQLTIPSMIAAVYVGMAALCVPAIGVCVTLYQRCKNGQDDIGT